MIRPRNGKTLESPVGSQCGSVTSTKTERRSGLLYVRPAAAPTVEPVSLTVPGVRSRLLSRIYYGDLCPLSSKRRGRGPGMWTHSTCPTTSSPSRPQIRVSPRHAPLEWSFPSRGSSVTPEPAIPHPCRRHGLTDGRRGHVPKDSQSRGFPPASAPSPRPSSPLVLKPSGPSWLTIPHALRVLAPGHSLQTL